MAILNTTRVTAVVIMAFSAAVYHTASNYPREAALLPEGLAIILAICAAAMLIKSFFPGTKTDSFRLKNPRQFCLGAVLMAGYVVMIYVAGYYLASLLFIAVLTWAVGFKKPVLACAVGVLYGAGIYLAFEYLLKIPMPAGLWQ